MSRIGRLGQGLALLALVFACYLPGLGGGFIFDDYPNIVQQPALHVTEPSLEAFAQATQIFGFGAGRTLPLLTFAIDHSLFGLDPGAFKRTNVVLHGLNALLMLLLMRRLLAQAGQGHRVATWAPFVLATLWALHPLQVSTVLYVVQRMEMLSLTFVLAGLGLYLAGRSRQVQGRAGWPWIAGSLVAMALGVACKETAVLFPAYCLALELTLLRFGAANPRTARLLRWAFAIGVVAGLALVLAMIPRFASPEAYAIREYSAVERVLTQFRVIPLYLGWILVPSPSSYLFYYDNYVASQGLFSPWTTAAGLLLLVAMAGAALGLRRRAPLFSLGLLWFLSAHLVTSSYLPLELVFEHRNYFAIIGVLLAGYDLARRVPFRSEPRLAAVAVVVLVLGTGLLGTIRSANWGNPMQLALELAERNPGSSRASTDLGEQYMVRAGNDPGSRYYAMAMQEFERGAAIPGSSPLPEQGLIVLAASAGQPAKPAWWDSAISKLRKRAIGPQELSLVVGFLDLSQRGYPIDDQRLAEAYIVLAERAAMPPVQYYAFGRHALEKVADRALAERLFMLAVDSAAGDEGLVQDIVRALAADGHRDMAEAVAAHARDAAGMQVRVPGPAEGAE